MNFKLKYRKYAEALYNALSEDAFYITMEKSIEDNKSAKEAMLRYMEFSMTEAEKGGALYIPKDHDYGVSIWEKPITEELAVKQANQKQAFILREMGEKSLKTYKAIVEVMSANAASYINKNFWYLSIVGVLPEFQGQGLGPGLIKNILIKTDTLGVSTYLETFTPRNMTFYKRLGFQEIKSFDEPTTKAEYWLMVRKPANKKDY